MARASVIIPLYNHSKYIQEAVCSILDQSYEDFELLIVNEGSTDNSLDMINSIQDSRIKVFSFNKQ